MCGKNPCECTPVPPGPQPDGGSHRFHESTQTGVPAQALKSLMDGFAEAKAAKIGSLVISLHGGSSDTGTDLRKLGLAVPQLPRSDVEVALVLNSQTGKDHLALEYRGGWEGYSRIRNTTESAVAETGKLDLKFDLYMKYRTGLLAADSLSNVRDILAQLSLGILRITATEASDE